MFYNDEIGHVTAFRLYDLLIPKIICTILREIVGKFVFLNKNIIK